MVWAEEHELDLLPQHDGGIVHNPQSNMKLACGVALLPSVLQRHLPVGLGTDDSSSNTNLSLWEEIGNGA